MIFGRNKTPAPSAPPLPEDSPDTQAADTTDTTQTLKGSGFVMYKPKPKRSGKSKLRGKKLIKYIQSQPQRSLNCMSLTEERNRDLDLSIYEGREVQLKLGHIINANQYVSGHLGGRYIGGWIGSVLGKENDTVVKTVKEAFLVQHSNGGRSSSWRAKSYTDYWNEDMKQKVMAWRSGGVMSQIYSRGGDYDRADILIYFTDGSKLDSMASIEPPEEWYSEQYADKVRRYLKRGFYADAKEALTDQDKSDDLFGERYFPVAVFPDGTSEEDIRECIWIPKNTSKAITVGGYRIYGSRCKPGEVGDFIEAVYRHGGKILKHSEWDW